MAYRGLNRRTLAALLFAAPFGLPRLAVAGELLETPAGAAEAPTAVESGENRYGHITAEVFVNDHGPFTFLVDTGANRSAISEGLAARLGLPIDSQVEVNTVIGARARPTVRVDTLRIADQVQRRVEIPTLVMSAGTADGILGVDWLRDHRLTFFFAERRLIIERSSGPAAPEAAGDGRSIIMPAQLKSGQLSLIDAMVAGQRVSAMIDTGAQFTLGNRALKAWAERRLGSVIPTQKIDINTVTGEAAKGDLMFLPGLRLGPVHFDQVPVVFSDVQVFKLWGMERRPALVLGLDLIGEFDAMSLDFGARLVRLDPPRSAGVLLEADRRRPGKSTKTGVL